jgi:hypothetical protein
MQTGSRILIVNYDYITYLYQAEMELRFVKLFISTYSTGNPSIFFMLCQLSVPPAYVSALEINNSAL